MLRRSRCFHRRSGRAESRGDQGRIGFRYDGDILALEVAALLVLERAAVGRRRRRAEKDAEAGHGEQDAGQSMGVAAVPPAAANFPKSRQHLDAFLLDFRGY